MAEELADQPHQNPLRLRMEVGFGVPEARNPTSAHRLGGFSTGDVLHFGRTALFFNLFVSTFSAISDLAHFDSPCSTSFKVFPSITKSACFFTRMLNFQLLSSFETVALGAVLFFLFLYVTQSKRSGGNYEAYSRQMCNTATSQKICAPLALWSPTRPLLISGNVLY